MAANRPQQVEKLKSLLETHYSGDVAADAIFDYLPNNFYGKSPIIAIAQSGSLFQKQARGKRIDQNRYLILFGHVATNKATPAGSDRVGQHKVGELISKFGEFLDTYDTVDEWFSILPVEEFSDFIPIELDKTDYYVEFVPIVLKV